MYAPVFGTVTFPSLICSYSQTLPTSSNWKKVTDKSIRTTDSSLTTTQDSRTKSWIFYEWKNAPRSPENQVPACRGVQVTMGRHKRAKRRANSARDLAQSGRVSAHLAIESGVPCRCSLRATYGRGHSLFTAWRSNSDLNALKIMHRLEGLSWELLTVTLGIFVFWIPRVSWGFLETPHSFRVTLSAFKRMKLIYWWFDDLKDNNKIKSIGICWRRQSIKHMYS